MELNVIEAEGEFTYENPSLEQLEAFEPGSFEIPFSRPCLGFEEMEAVERVIESGWLTQGPEVEAFEKEAAAMLGAPEGHECVAVSSCTAALYLLATIVFNRGDKVLVPNLTFAATANAVIAAGAFPVIADVDQDGCLAGRYAPDGADGQINVAFGGIVRHDIMAMAKPAIFDQAHRFQPGAYLPFSGWSFFPTKNITTGEGGLIGCDRDSAFVLRHCRDHGRVSTYEALYAGALNFRMTDIQAAIGREQIKKLPWMLARKAEISKVYREELTGCVKLPPEGVTHLFWIRTPRRDELKERLAGRGIQTSIHYKPLSEMPAFREYCRGVEFSVSKQIARETLSLPFFPDMTADEARFVARQVRDILSCGGSQFL